MIKYNWLVVLGIWFFTAVGIIFQPIVGILFACASMMTTAVMLEYARKAGVDNKTLPESKNTGKVKRNQKKRRFKQKGRNAPGARTW